MPARTSLDPSIVADYAIALLASCGIGYALGFNWGQLSAGAMAPLLVAGVLLLWRLLARARGRAPATLRAELVWVPLVSLLLAMAWAMHEDRVLWHAPGLSPVGRQAQLGIVALLLSYLPSALGAREPAWINQTRFVLLALLVCLIGFDTIKLTPRPKIDVWSLQQRATALLSRGLNPYSDRGIKDSYWGMRVSFPYPPTAIYTGWFGRKLFGDVRYSNLFLIVMTGTALSSIVRRARVRLPAIGEDAPALVLWLQPRLFFVLEQGWIDVIPLAFLSGGLMSWLDGRRRLALVLLGIAVSSKQTMFWFLPLFWLFLDLRGRDWLWLLGTMLVLIGPFVIWDFGALWAATVSLHESLQPRQDALGFMAWYFAKYQHWQSTAWLAWTSCFGLLGLAALRLRGRVPAFGLAAASIYFLFFFFEKQAFANYYYFVAGLAALAATMALLPERKMVLPP